MNYKVKEFEVRAGCRDNFNAFMVSRAKFTAPNDIPYCPTTLHRFLKG